VISDQKLLEQIDANAAEFFGNPQMHPLYGAPTLIVVSGTDEGNVASGNAAMIVHNMALAAVDLGVGHCDIYGAIAALNTNAELVAKLNLPEGHKPIAAIIVGQSDEVYAERTIDENRIRKAYIG
jgi:nitroreductase